MQAQFSKLFLLVSVSMLWLFVSVSAKAATPIHHVSSEVCKSCHMEIYKQWKGSMHAQSSALEDPIHATFYGMVMGDPTKEGVKSKKGTYPVCLQCHAPNAAKDKTTKLDAKPAYAEGVNCVVCHTLAEYKGTEGEKGKPNLGLKAYVTSNKLQGPQGFKTKTKDAAKLTGPIKLSDIKPNPHLGKSVDFDDQALSLPMEANPALMKSNKACMGCHDKRSNMKKVPLCRTGDEYKESATEVTCTSCHMPISGGIASHEMGGGHDHAMLKRSVVFAVESKKKGDKLETVVSMKNKQAHSMPTGAPFRNLHLKLTAYDADGNVVWENAKGHPGKDDPQAYLMLELLDDTGKRTSPPLATQLGEDTRLKAYEERNLNYSIPAENVALVRGELFYSLLWPELSKKFSEKLPAELTAPVSIAMSEVKI
jgi:hypothetical protein